MRVGELEVDWDAQEWADWDERVHGFIDTPEHKKKYPDGFTWSCCEQSADADTCYEKEHVPAM